MCRLQPVRPTGRRPHLHFNLFVCDLCVYPSHSSPSNLLLFLLLSAHLSADEEDQALISEKTGDLSLSWWMRREVGVDEGDMRELDEEI